jgi:DNA-binding LytR/AlgR family response regulator
MQLTALIVEDEPPARERLQALLEELPQVRLVGAAPDGPSAVKMLEELRPKLAFLDIHLPGFDGFEVLSRSRHRPLVVFVTAYDQYAIRAFEENAVDYLLKPFSPERVREAVERVEQRNRSLSPEVLDSLVSALSRDRFLRRFSVRQGEEILIVPESQAVFFKATEKRVFLCTDQREFAADFTLKELEERLDPERFLRIHKSFIVAVDRVRKVSRWFREHYVVVMDDRAGTRLTVGRGHLQAFRRRFNLTGSSK